MLRDNRVGLIEPNRAAREIILSRCAWKPNKYRTIDPQCLENPRPKGGTSTLAENAPSPFQAEPKHSPSRLFGLESPIGKTYDFVLHRENEDGRVRYFGLAQQGSAEACTFDFDKPNMPDCIRTSQAGRLFVSPKYLRELSFDKKGLAALSSETLGWMYARRSGEIVITDVATLDNGPDEFHDGMVRVIKHGKFAFADRSGKLRIPPEYDWASPFDHGRAMVCRQCRIQRDHWKEHSWFVGGKWFMIDVHGQVFTACSHDYCQ
jgi:hypothetical protein